MWEIPHELAAAKDDLPVLKIVTGQIADPDAFIARVKYLYENKHEKSHEDLVLKDGRVFDRYSAPMIDATGHYYGRIWYFRDITERKTAEQNIINRAIELEEAYAELKSAQSRILQQDKMASIGQLAAGIAHEINNPIGFIISNLGSLEKYLKRISDFIGLQSEAAKLICAEDGARRDDIMKDLEDRKQSMKIDYILNDLNNLVKESLDGADRVKKIVQELKSFSRLDESEIKITDINAGLDSTINIIWNELKYKTSVLREYGEIPLIKCNPGQLNQVFMNILLNAAQAIPVKGDITVKTWTDSMNIHVSITDTGSGISPKNIGRIFEPFFTTKDVGSGTGLGLSIAYDIVKKHGGDIAVESEVGKGTTFLLTIPIVND